MRRGVLLRVAVAVGGIAPLAFGQAPPSGEAAAAGSERVVVTVDDARLTAGDVEKLLATMPLQTREYYAGPGRHLLPQYLVRLKLLSEQARQLRLEEQPEIRRAIEVATDSILAEAARKRIEQSIPAPEEALQQMYQARIKEFEEARLRRILIRTEESVLSQSSAPTRPPLSSAEARKKLEGLRQQILAGGDFAELARQHSDDAASAPLGGDIGFVNYRTVIPPIIQAADRLAPGEVSEIIPTAFGLELIQVVEKRARPLAEVRAQLEAALRQNKLEETLQELQSRHKISVDQ
ncbi:MAG TPA: peptidylprolyl isomerase, partial [Terriglobia bacterium]|nr:peptidylprolyl isomerase [Terriglobia bacterium]